MSNNNHNAKSNSSRIIAFLLITVLSLNEFASFSYGCNLLSHERFTPQYHFSINDDFLNEKTDVTVEKERNEKLSSIQMMAPLSGPGQTETSGFSLNSTDGLVDKFTGDFSYSIPLMSVEGYPINISYNSNVGVHSEASCVGLGWDLNVGTISREMRGIPDEFNGEDIITRTLHEKKNETTDANKLGVYAAVGYKLPGIGKGFFVPSIQITSLWGGYQNTILGYGKTFDFALQGQFSLEDKDEKKSIGPNFSFGYSSDTKNGVGINKSFGISADYSSKGQGQGLQASGGVSFGNSFNSRAGLTSYSFSYDFSAGYAKEKAIFSGFNGGVAFSTYVTYGTATFIPRIPYNVIENAKSSSTKLFVGASPTPNSYLEGGLIFRNYEITNALASETHSILQPAFGYLHSGKRDEYNVENMYPVMDFNRSSDVSYSEEMKNLAFSTQNFDLFYVSGLGLSGSFRARRDDVGTYYDPMGSQKVNDNKAIENVQDLLGAETLDLVDDVELSAGVVFGQPMKLKLGLSAMLMPGNTESTILTTQTNASAIQFSNFGTGNKNNFDATTYFKSIGELTPEPMALWNGLNAGNADYLDIIKFEKNLYLSNHLHAKNEDINPDPINSLNVTEQPNKIRATIINPIVASSPELKSQFESVDEAGNIRMINRTNSNLRKANHISAIEVISTDGTKYCYGTPVYNIKNDEVSFAIGDKTPHSSDNSIIDYNPGEYVNHGWTNYYDKTEMPGYAHSFLLTEMYSSDYVDRTNNGPSLDDIGSYYKINHTMVYGELTEPYRWRFPYSAGSTSEALYSRGILGSDLDNMAHYTYGEKEIWYTQSVESKNLIAVFEMENRKDGYGVMGENGGMNVNTPLKALKSIKLYNKADKLANPTTCEPIQTIIFVYDYSLCPKTPSNIEYKNNQNGNDIGKLTLREIRVYNGSSEELAMSAYKFDYSNVNPAFNYSNLDGWGNYKMNNPQKPNDLYPYSNQNKTVADAAISAYKIVTIHNPSGGKIQINYEADSYNFVQDKRAMEHVDIYKMTNLFDFIRIQNEDSWNGNLGTYNTFTTKKSNVEINQAVGNSFDPVLDIASTLSAIKYCKKFGKFNKDLIPNNIVIFPLDNSLFASLSESEAIQKLKDLYFKGSVKENNQFLKELYFRMMITVKKEDNASDEIKELVNAFAKISDNLSNVLEAYLPSSMNDSFEAFGLMPKVGNNSDYTYGYVILEPTNSGEKEGQDGYDNGGIIMHPLQLNALDFVRTNLPDIVYGSCDGCTPDLDLDNATTAGRDMYKYMIKHLDYVPSFSSGSTIRLNSAKQSKIGGNARVASIEYFDNWDYISGEYQSTYKWNYKYEDGGISYGVASYEPKAIRDENPFYKWDSYKNIRKHFVDESKFDVLPMAESLYPNPIVGYSNVKVEFSSATNKGYSEATFYTAYDKPTITKSTSVNNSVRENKNIFVIGKTVDLYGFSQGYVVQTNDFHGKPKEMSTYNGLGVKQARTTYKYYDFNEKVNFVKRDGQVVSEFTSLEYDIHADSRKITDETNVTKIGVNLTWNLPSPIPVPSPIFFKTSRNRGFFSTVLVKHLNQSAIVKSIETDYLGSINSAENTLYDYYTGNIILSSLNDEFNDKLYSLNYPSHWYYPNLRDLSTVGDITINGSVTSGKFSASISDFTAQFSKGDKVELSTSPGSNLYVLDLTPQYLVLINENGSKVTTSGSCSLTLVESNRSNRLNETMQNVVTKINPMATGTFQFPTTNIIASSAVTYTEKNNVLCGEPGWVDHSNKVNPNNEVKLDNSPINPFKYGVKGDLVMDKQFNWQDDRTKVGLTGIRHDGVYASYIPFYQFNSQAPVNKWYRVNEYGHPSFVASNPLHNWRPSGEITVYNEYGSPVESIDQLGIYSSIIYGYNDAYKLIPVAQAINARQQDIAFDGFEDYTYLMQNPMLNDQSHFDFKSALSNNVVITDLEKHSGFNSLMIKNGANASVQKSINPIKNTYSCSDPAYEGINDGEFIPKECLCIKPFSPSPETYIISVWIKEDDAMNKTQYNNAEIGIFLDNVLIATFAPSGKIIDGWQRLEGEFVIDNNSSNITIQLINKSNEHNVYFDDLRIHPFYAGMSTVVYDPKTLLPMASHDGYNFTTFYNYDENLNQVRVRVETVNGIQTISESEFGVQK